MVHRWCWYHPLGLMAGHGRVGGLAAPLVAVWPWVAPHPPEHQCPHHRAGRGFVLWSVIQAFLSCGSGPHIQLVLESGNLVWEHEG